MPDGLLRREDGLKHKAYNRPYPAHHPDGLLRREDGLKPITMPGFVITVVGPDGLLRREDGLKQFPGGYLNLDGTPDGLLRREDGLKQAAELMEFSAQDLTGYSDVKTD